MPYQPKPCRMCGGPKDRIAQGVRYCTPCNVTAKALWAAKHPSREWTHEQRFANQSVAAHKAVAVRRERHPHMFKPESAEAFWQRKAMSMVASAKRAGILPQLDGTIACQDCGGAAEIYEHRDYGRPLDVVPVCQQCNHQRGTAVWPSADVYNFARVTDH